MAPERQTRVIEPLHEGEGRWCIDTAIEEFAPDGLVVDIRGWLAVPSALGPIEGPFLTNGKRRRVLSRFERRDVEAELPGMAAVGFDEVIDVAALSAAGFELTVLTGGLEERLPLPDIASADELAERFLAHKAAVAERLLGRIACPICHSPLAENGTAFECPVHGRVGSHLPLQFELLGPERHLLAPSPPFSSHRYDEEPREMIRRFSDGLVVDDGCGLRYEAFDAVANLDITPFPLTDVLASADALPFRDGSVDGLITVAVLEHVPDPARCVAEIGRVVRPGGAIYAAVPFLQPYHGYPDHYFNMTRDGMRTLFQPYFEVEEIFTPFGGLPMRTLSWFLDRYLASLPSEVAERFSKMTVGELAGDPVPHLHEPYVEALDEATVAELSSVNVLMGRRLG